MRSADLRYRGVLKKELTNALEGASDELTTQIARAATLSAPEAQRMLDMAAERSDAIDDEQVARARQTIERYSVAP